MATQLQFKLTGQANGRGVWQVLARQPEAARDARLYVKAPNELIVYIKADAAPALKTAKKLTLRLVIAEEGRQDLGMTAHALRLLPLPGQDVLAPKYENGQTLYAKEDDTTLVPGAEVEAVIDLTPAA